MKRIVFSLAILAMGMKLLAQTPISYFPLNQAKDINVDTHLIIDGGGDTILGRGPSYFNHCIISSYGAFMWIRNTKENHGNIFNDCTFKAMSQYAMIARLPDNKGKNYPDAECVLLNCTLDGVPSEGFGPIAESASTAKLYEFNSHSNDGKNIDVSGRDKHVKQFDAIKDAELIGKYSDAQWVLGW